jgi:UDP-glucuronate 4-epimerase
MNLSFYYDVRLKHGRLREAGIEMANNYHPFGTFIQSKKYSNYKFIRLHLEDSEGLQQLFVNEKFDKVVNLAAQAGVRYSITNPHSYINSNIIGFLNILECCRNHPVQSLVYASSSSVYGSNSQIPFCEEDNVDNPISLYAASKKANELMAHCYSKLYNIPTSGLRFFTVYGPWGRPDMAPMLFASSILKSEPVKVFNNGDLMRDFTYIDDIVEGTVRAIDNIPMATNCPNNVPYKVYNIGCSNPVRLMDFISEIEIAIGKPAKKTFLPMQQGDVYQTYADTKKLESELGYQPNTTLQEGVARFIEWYKSDKNPLK